MEFQGSKNPPLKNTSALAQVHSFLEDRDFIRVAQDIGLDILFDALAVAARDAQDQVVQRAAAEDIDVIAFTKPLFLAQSILGF